MAKALVGHMGGPSVDHVRETAVLRRRVAELQAEVDRLSTENEGLLRTLAERVEQASADGLLEPLAH